ncbi:TPA: hypothetical protein DCG86_09250 [Candidatus Marinimicrobia bacterium]|nr:hypothetical protein [Candidatus Neomarinimicrobiota bacterium]
MGAMNAGHDFIGNVAILEESLRREYIHKLFFKNWVGEVKLDKGMDPNSRKYIPSGKMVEVFPYGKEEGRDNILIPFLKNLTGEPVYGDTVLKGTGEELSMRWLRAYVNQERKAVMKRTGQMAEQRAKLYKLYEEAKPQLALWFSRVTNVEFFRSVYEGASANLTAAQTVDGVGLVKRYHPNFYYMSAAGTISAVGTEYKTKTAAELDAAVGNVDGINIDAAGLRKLRTKCINLKIQPVYTKDGNPFFVLVAHPDQVNTLKADSDYKAAQRDAFTGKMLDSPELNGAIGYYEGFAIFEEYLGARGWDTTNDNFFGSTMATAFEPTTVTSNACALVLGAQAIGIAEPRKLHYTNEEDDHGNIIEIGGARIYGIQRADFVPEDDAGESSGDLFYITSSGGVASAITCINQSSLILMTDEN